MDRAGETLGKLIGLLLALNFGVLLAGLALQYGTLDSPAALVFNAEKIQLLALPSVPEPSQALSPAIADRPIEPDVATQPGTSSRCLSWPTLDPASLAAVEARLLQAGIATSAYDIELQKTLGWWVFLAPSENKEAVQAKLDEITRIGITDFAVVRGGTMLNAVSLGAFARLSKAREHARRLSDKGLKDVHFGPRPEAGLARLTMAESVGDDVLATLQTDWPKALQPAPCTLP